MPLLSLVPSLCVCVCLCHCFRWYHDYCFLLSLLLDAIAIAIMHGELCLSSCFCCCFCCCFCSWKMVSPKLLSPACSLPSSLHSSSIPPTLKICQQWIWRTCAERTQFSPLLPRTLPPPLLWAPHLLRVIGMLNNLSVKEEEEGQEYKLVAEVVVRTLTGA